MRSLLSYAYNSSAKTFEIGACCTREETGGKQVSEAHSLFG